MPFLLRIGLLLCLPLLAQSQTESCGSQLRLLDEKSLATARQFYHKERFAELRTQNIDSIPITIHLVRSNTGNPEPRYEEMEAIVEQTNQAFAPLGMSFYICGSPRYLDGKTNYAFNEAEGLNRGQHVANTINLFLVDGIKSPNGGLFCGLSKFPFQADPDERYILLDKDCAITGITLIHELGHYFGLLHTHEDRFGRELVNGYNCHAAGDLICDTPADPNLGLTNAIYNCEYIGRRVDINGDIYRPSVQNFMSYAPPYCQQEFSRDQRSFVRAIAQEEYAYLTGSGCEIRGDLSIEGELEAISISAFDQIPATFQVYSEALPDLAEISLRISLFETRKRQRGTLLYEEKIRFPAEQSLKKLDLNFILPEVKTSGTYYLVAEIDADFEIIEATESNNRFIQEIKIDNSKLANLTVFPNPAQEILYFYFRSPRTRGPYTMNVFRPDGVEILRTTGTQVRNEVLRQIDVSQLPTGIYLAHIKFKNSNTRRSLRFFKR